MESLIVDVRYNGGGSVSQLLLEKFAETVKSHVRDVHIPYFPSALPVYIFPLLFNQSANSGCVTVVPSTSFLHTPMKWVET